VSVRDQVAGLDFFAGLPANVIGRVAEAASIQSFAAGQVMVHEHDRADAVFFLLSGSVSMFTRVESVDDLLVGASSGAGTLLGWSAFRPPYRYTASVKCEENVQALRVQAAPILRLIDEDPDSGAVLLRRVAICLAQRLDQTRVLLTEHARHTEF
jgi:CRP-like cAMP-binding protein